MARSQGGRLVATVGATTLRSLASTTVIVAPNTDVPTGNVVATAWGWKQTRTGVDQPALVQFVHDREGHGPSDKPTPTN